MKKRKKGTAVRHSRTTAHARTKSRAPAGSKHVRKEGARRQSHVARARSGAARKGRSAKSSAEGVFALSADCTVAESAALKSSLLQTLARPTPVTIDITCVQRIDTAGIQLIAAFVREREALGLQVHWRGTAPAFTSAARLLGVASVLRLPEPTP
jgi:phospholipid transport system transporter-binding protein